MVSFLCYMINNFKEKKMKNLALALVMVFGTGMISNAVLAFDNGVKTEVTKEKKRKKKDSKTCTANGEKKACCSKGGEKK